MFEDLDDPVGPSLDATTRSRVAAIVRRRQSRRHAAVAAVLAAVLLLPLGLVVTRAASERRVSAGDVGEPLPGTATTTTEALEIVPDIGLPTSTTTTPTTTSIPQTTAPAAPAQRTPPSTAPPGTPRLEGEWALRATLTPDPDYGPNVKGEAGARRVEGTPYRWVGTFVASGLVPNSSGTLLISHESRREGRPSPFASTACRYTANASGRAMCSGEFDTYEYTNDPDRFIAVASVMGPSGNMVAHAAFR